MAKFKSTTGVILETKNEFVLEQLRKNKNYKELKEAKPEKKDKD